MILDYYSRFSIWLSSVCIISNKILSSIHYYAVLFKAINIIVMMHYCDYNALFFISMQYYSIFSVLLSSLCMVINTMHNYLLLWNIIEYSHYDHLHHALLLLLLTNMYDSGLLFNILDMIIISMHYYQYSFVEYSLLCSIIQDNQNYCHDALLSLLWIILH